MTTVRINMQSSRNIVAIKLNVVVHAIDRQHSVVVVREEDAGTRSDTRHLKVGAILLFLLLAGILAKQIVVRTLMSIALHHCYDGIEQYLEIRLSVALRLCSYCRGKVSASRAAHETNILLIDMPIGSIAAHNAHSLLGIANGLKVKSVSQEKIGGKPTGLFTVVARVNNANKIKTIDKDADVSQVTVAALRYADGDTAVISDFAALKRQMNTNFSVRYADGNKLYANQDGARDNSAVLSFERGKELDLTKVL